MGTGLAILQSGVVLVDTRLQPIASDSGAAYILGPHQPNRHVTLIPDELMEAIRTWNSSDQPPSRVSVWIGSQRYRCRLYNVMSDNPALSPSLTAVHLEADSDGADPVRRVATDYHLTDREHEALRGIALGLSTKELANRMMISPNTVKSFVRLIMIKLGVTSRAAILGRILEAAVLR